jgi:glutaconyl-CoA/methylmalonyl-CoA decarboxylase subunit gamma
MKYQVTVDGKTYLVEIQDPHARPVIAVVDGEAFEVWPEPPNGRLIDIPPADRSTASAPMGSGSIRTPALSREIHKGSPAHDTAPGAEPAARQVTGLLSVVKAPIPGVITSVDVQPGDEVKVGQQMVALEAMKMNNSIRSTRQGTVGAVHVRVGQTVRHGELLVTFNES